MEKYANKETVVKNEIYESFYDTIICPICSNLILEPTMCLKCQNTYCRNCIKDWMTKKQTCPNDCENPEFKDIISKKNPITKFKFKCIKGCGDEILFNDLINHYNTNCLSKKKQMKLLTPKQAADYTKNTGKKIPKFISKKIFINFIFIVITLGISGVGKSSLIST